MLRVVSLAAMLIAINGSAAAAAPAAGPCEVATLEAYTKLANGCDIGNFNFSMFSDAYSPFPNPNNITTDAASITVTPISVTLFGIVGFKFEQDNGYWTLTSPRIYSFTDDIEYRITALTGSGMAVNAAILYFPRRTIKSIKGDGSYVRVQETVPGGRGAKCNGDNPCIEVQAKPPVNTTEASTNITPAATAISIDDLVDVKSADSDYRTSRASLKSFTNLFVGTALPPVAGGPEPSTWVMMVIGLGFVGGLGRAGRRRPHPASTTHSAGTWV